MAKKPSSKTKKRRPNRRITKRKRTSTKRKKTKKKTSRRNPSKKRRTTKRRTAAKRKKSTRKTKKASRKRKHPLRDRKNWQKISGKRASAAEYKFYKVFDKEFKGKKFKIDFKPKDFLNIYSDVPLPKKVKDKIYNPRKKWKHGIRPEFTIENTKTKKKLYVEIKRQDGWVEGKKRSAGRGNAHERLGKYFTPGLLKLLRENGKLGARVLPFWIVFLGNIARDPARTREITYWFGEQNSAHFFFWSKGKAASDEKKAVINHFNYKLKRLLK